MPRCAATSRPSVATSPRPAAARRSPSCASTSSISSDRTEREGGASNPALPCAILAALNGGACRASRSVDRERGAPSIAASARSSGGGEREGLVRRGMAGGCRDVVDEERPRPQRRSVDERRSPACGPRARPTADRGSAQPSRQWSVLKPPPYAGPAPDAATRRARAHFDALSPAAAAARSTAERSAAVRRTESTAAVAFPLGSRGRPGPRLRGLTLPPTARRREAAPCPTTPT